MGLCFEQDCSRCQTIRMGCPCDGALDDGCFHCTPDAHPDPGCIQTKDAKGCEFCAAFPPNCICTGDDSPNAVLFNPATGETSPADPRLEIGEVTDDGRIVVPASLLPDPVGLSALELWLNGWRAARRQAEKGR